VSDINDALNELAQRGEPRGFDQVLAGATESAASDAARRDAEGDDLDTIPFVTSEPAARGRRSRSFGSMIAAAGVAALVLVGAFAVSAVVGQRWGRLGRVRRSQLGRRDLARGSAGGRRRARARRGAVFARNDR
jgi:hypothetical protein